MLHLKLDKVQKHCGFLMADLARGQYGWAMCKGFVHSDQREFYQCVDQFSKIYLKGLFIDNISSFLVIHHGDLSADVYINDFPLKMRVLPNRNLSVGEVTMIEDIADIDELMFEGVDIKEDDCIVFCFKKGWKLGLFFDLLPDGKDHFLDVEALYHELGKHYKYLAFQDAYAVLENKQKFGQMFNDGWFPFVQILGGGFEQLAVFYKDRDKFAPNIENFIGSFDEKRVMSFANNWWRNLLFKEKQKLIESGIQAYFQGNYIACIKTLYSEIGGVMEIGYVKETKKAKPYFRDLICYVQQKAKDKFVSPNSLGFPDVFFRYLDEVIFKVFNLQTGEVDLSRHSALHGVARPEDYTRVKALQAILVLDQMYRYLT